MTVLGPVVDEQQEPGRGQALDETVEERLGLAVDPLEILDEDEEGLDLALAQQQSLDAVERALTALGRIEPFPCGVAVSDVEQREQRGQRRLERRVERRGDLAANLLGVVRLLDGEVRSQQLHDGQVRRRLAVGHRAGLEHAPALGVGRVQDFPGEARLADAGLADDAHHLPVAGADPVERAAHLFELDVAAEEARQAAREGGVQARAAGPHARDLVDVHRLAHPLDGHRAERDDGHGALGEPDGAGGRPDRLRRGRLLHAGGEVRALAHRRVVHVQVAGDGAHDDLAGVQADADLDGGPVGSPHGVGVALHRLLHAQRRVAGARRVVLEGERRAEEGHDAVAHHLVHRALVAVNGVHHQLEHGIEELAGLLGVAVGQQLHRALHVGEENGHLLALALEGLLRGQDPLDEVAGRVALGRGEPRRRRWRGLAALVAEPGAGGKVRATLVAGRGKRRAALETELRLRRIVVPAPETLHARLPNDGETVA